jgi:plasmid stabilization system protein ParE
MKYTVVALGRAETDIRHIVRWIAQRSPQGAMAWIDAYDQLVGRLAAEADSFSAAIEDADCEIDLRQALFATRRGRTYRAVFAIVGRQVRILRIRGPGQPPLQNDELW